MLDFRTRLKAATADAHDRVDAGYGALDLAVREDFALFLQGQYIGHVLTQSSYQPDQGFPALTKRIEMIAEDLRLLQIRPINPEPELADISANKRPYHELGLTYVIAGSLHGANVLKKMWKVSSDDVVLSASNFMNFSGLQCEWASVIAKLRAGKIRRTDEEDIIRSARHAFHLFETGLGLAKGD